MQLSNIIKDRFWIWGHEAGSYNMSRQFNGSYVVNSNAVVNHYNLPSKSRMTPAESAFYLGVPNVIMVRYANKPEPPYDTYARSFCPLKQVIWSIIGDGLTTLNNNAPETDEVIRLAGKFPNIIAAVMDDLSPERISLEQLKLTRSRLKNLSRPLDLWMVSYLHAINPNLKPYLEQSDVVTLWTWKQEDLVNLAANMEKVKAFIPGKRMVLGCYMYDFGNKKPMLVENMQRQCELGLEWLKAGQIEGMIFCGSCICDVELEAVEWTRKWISAVGDKSL